MLHEHTQYSYIHDTAIHFIRKSKMVKYYIEHQYYIKSFAQHQNHPIPSLWHILTLYIVSVDTFIHIYILHRYIYYIAYIIHIFIYTYYVYYYCTLHILSHIIYTALIYYIPMYIGLDAVLSIFLAILFSFMVFMVK